MTKECIIQAFVAKFLLYVSMCIEDLHASNEDLSLFLMEIDEFHVWIAMLLYIIVSKTNDLFCNGRAGGFVRES